MFHSAEPAMGRTGRVFSKPEADCASLVRAVRRGETSAQAPAGFPQRQKRTRAALRRQRAIYGSRFALRGCGAPRGRGAVDRRRAGRGQAFFCATAGSDGVCCFGRRKLGRRSLQSRFGIAGRQKRGWHRLRCGRGERPCAREKRAGERHSAPAGRGRAESDFEPKRDSFASAPERRFDPAPGGDGAAHRRRG